MYKDSSSMGTSEGLFVFQRIKIPPNGHLRDLKFFRKASYGNRTGVGKSTYDVSLPFVHFFLLISVVFPILSQIRKRERNSPVFMLQN
jgi:hypothetical protein